MKTRTRREANTRNILAGDTQRIHECIAEKEDMMDWIRTSKEDGLEERVTEARAMEAATSYYRNPGDVIVAAKQNGIQFQTPFFWYGSRPGNQPSF